MASLFPPIISGEKQDDRAAIAHPTLNLFPPRHPGVQRNHSVPTKA